MLISERSGSEVEILVIIPSKVMTGSLYGRHVQDLRLEQRLDLLGVLVAFLPPCKGKPRLAHDCS
jgi:hypothetical protein